MRLFFTVIILFISSLIHAQTGNLVSYPQRLKSEIPLLFESGCAIREPICKKKKWIAHLQNAMVNEEIIKDFSAGEHKVIFDLTIGADGCVSDVHSLDSSLTSRQKKIITREFLACQQCWIPAYEFDKPIVSHRIQPLTFVVDPPADEALILDRVYVEAMPDSGWRNFVAEVGSTKDLEFALPKGNYSSNVRIIIGKDGCVINAVCIRDSCLTNNQRSIIEQKFMSYPGKWKPDMQNGRYVKFYHLQPITFIVNKPAEIHAESCQEKIWY